MISIGRGNRFIGTGVNCLGLSGPLGIPGINGPAVNGVGGPVTYQVNF